MKVFVKKYHERKFTTSIAYIRSFSTLKNHFYKISNFILIENYFFTTIIYSRPTLLFHQYNFNEPR